MTETPLKIIVVGTAAGGMSAAVRARRLDEKASITVIEQGAYVSYANSGVPSAVGGVLETDSFIVHQTAAGLKTRFNLDVRDHTEVVSISRDQHLITVRRSDIDEKYQLPYDKLVLAQGADLVSPFDDQKINASNVFTLRILPDLERIRVFIMKNQCRHVAIVGGGYIGLKAVESVYGFGLEISMIEADDRVCSDFDSDFSRMIQTELAKNGVQLHFNSKVQRIAVEMGEDDRYVELTDGSRVPADLVIVATSLRPRTSMAENAGLDVRNGVVINFFMQTSDPDIYAVGDMAETQNCISRMPQVLGLPGPSNRQGRLAADHIFKRATAYRGNVGTYTSKVFHLTAAITGLSAQRLKEAGYCAQSVTVHTPDHAGYYPATQQMTMRVAFEPGSGRLLGAQIIGHSGVDKRIDVLSTALQSGMTVFDLENLELSFAPQYGSGKDPVNVAGMMGSNLLRGDLHTISAQELLQHVGNWQLIDVRSPENYSQGHVPSARNIPIDTLREQVASIDKGRPVVVYSRVGYHGYLAYRTLVQLGHTVVNLDGGLKLLFEGGFQKSLTSSAK